MVAGTVGTTTTTAQPLSTTTTTQSVTTAVVASSLVLRSASFTKVIDSCQTNILATVSLYCPDLFMCAIQCYHNASCTGVNYWEATQRCDIVSSNGSFPAPIVGCQYYVITRIY
nr:mucin-2-like [Biomphalaria glabrata]